MNRHLTENESIGYVHQLLTDAERENFERHLASCGACRSATDAHIQRQSSFRSRLDQELGALTAPPGMDFATIAPRLRESRRSSMLAVILESLRTYAPALAAVAGVVLAIAALLRNVTWPAVGLQQNHTLTLPFAAGLLFSFPVLSHYREDPLQRSTRWRIWIPTVLLWLGTAILGLYEIALLREVILRAYARFSPASSQWLQQAQALGSWGVFLMGAVWIALVIGGAEYHYRHAGQRSSWRLFTWTLLTQVAALALPLLL